MGLAIFFFQEEENKKDYIDDFWFTERFESLLRKRLQLAEERINE